jgi:hypothetical protein
VHVNINVQSVHGASGHHVDHTTLEGIDIVPVTQSAHDAPVEDTATLSVTMDLQDTVAPPPPPEGRSMDVVADSHQLQQGADTEGEEHPEIAATVYRGDPAEDADVPPAPDQELATSASSQEPASEPEQPPPAPGHLAPYLTMVGAEDGGNGAQQPGSDASAPYLEAIGVTPDTANTAGQPDAAAADHTVAVPDHDPFAAPDQTEDQVQAIEGTPGEEAPVEQPILPDADLDTQHHG